MNHNSNQSSTARKEDNTVKLFSHSEVEQTFEPYADYPVMTPAELADIIADRAMSRKNNPHEWPGDATIGTIISDVVAEIEPKLNVEASVFAGRIIESLGASPRTTHPANTSGPDSRTLIWSAVAGVLSRLGVTGTIPVGSAA